MPSNNGPSSIPSSLEDHHASFKKMVRYRECLKNHAAAMGGNATVVWKEIEGEATSCDYYHGNPHFSRVGRKVILGHHKNILPPEALGYPTAAGTFVPSRAAAAPHHQMIMSYNMGSLPSESDEQEDGG
ncbi:hypothetical protein GH714_007367 [Hevea brasiliensis]|uniref:Uncharacterized protein n=1 Tax=Hevea brasiliensis TaxID=3981 RepID=A0A6A6KYH5_HEVBR|nr:hypothetical protein GH714_007367 [Hevea brasiliensis]